MLSNFKKILQEAFETSNPGGQHSLSLETQRSYFKTYSLKDVLPYQSYKDGVYINQTTMGFVLEGTPLVGFDEESHRMISSLFETILPEKSNIQFLLYADPFIGDTVDQWVEPRIHSNEMMKRIALARADFFKQLAAGDNPFLFSRVFKIFISVTLPYQDDKTFDHLHIEVLELKERVQQILQSAGMYLESLTPESLINFISDILPVNLTEQQCYHTQSHYSDLDFISEQCFSQPLQMEITPKGLRLNIGLDAMEFKGYQVMRYPSNWSQSSMSDLIGDFFQETQQIPYPFFMHYGVHIPAQDELVIRHQAKCNHLERQINSPMMKYIPSMKQEYQEMNFVTNQLAQNQRFVKTNMTIGIVSKAEDALRAQQSLLNLFRAKGFDLKEDRYLHLQSLLTLLPMRFGDDFLKDLSSAKKLKTTLSSESANLLPLQGEWVGTGSSGMMFLGRRGQIALWSPFDNKGGNYNVSVVGRSGSGKSVFMQELMTSTLGQGGCVFVLDVGRSFEKTCLLLKGQFVEFTNKTKGNQPILCVNPFSTIDFQNADEAQEALSMLKSVICTMAAPSTQLSDLEKNWLEKAMNETCLIYKEETSITKLCECLLRFDDQRAKDLASMLYPYTKDGMYGRFFEGKANVDFNNPLVVVELEELKERKDLQSVIVQMVIINITNKMFLGDRRMPFMIVFDEAWDMLKGSQSGVFIETLARRLRKYNGSLVVGTQSMNDFYQTPGAQAAFENSDWLCLLSQKPESINVLKETKRMSMNAFVEKMLRSVTTKSGLYAECMISGSHGNALVRLVLDPFSNILYSTKANEYAAVKNLVEEGMEMEEAVCQVAGLRR